MLVYRQVTHQHGTDKTILPLNRLVLAAKNRVEHACAKSDYVNYHYLMHDMSKYENEK